MGTVVQMCYLYGNCGTNVSSLWDLCYKCVISVGTVAQMCHLSRNRVTELAQYWKFTSVSCDGQGLDFGPEGKNSSSACWKR